MAQLRQVETRIDILTCYSRGWHLDLLGHGQPRGEHSLPRANRDSRCHYQLKYHCSGRNHLKMISNVRSPHGVSISVPLPSLQFFTPRGVPLYLPKLSWNNGMSPCGAVDHFTLWPRYDFHGLVWLRLCVSCSLSAAMPNLPASEDVWVVRKKRLWKVLS